MRMRLSPATRCDMNDDTYWNYRILKRKSEAGKPYFGLVEIYYEHDQPIGWTQHDFVTCDEDEGAEGIVRTLMLMLKDAQKHPILDEQVLQDSLPVKGYDADTKLSKKKEERSIFEDKDAVEQFFGKQEDTDDKA